MFSHFSGVPRKFFHEYKHLSLIIPNNEHLWPRQCESISMITSMGLKPWKFSPANLSPSMIVLSIISLINISWHIASYYVKSHVCMFTLTFTLHHLVSSLDHGLISSTIDCLYPLTACTREPTAVAYNNDHKCITICDQACRIDHVSAKYI